MSHSASSMVRGFLAASLACAAATTVLAQGGAAKASTPTPGAKAEASVFRHDYEGVLGTSMHLEIRGEEVVAKQARMALAAEIERLRAILSTWDAKSEFNRIARPSEHAATSPELRAVLRECDKWRASSKGAFNCGVEELARLWRDACKRGSPPSTEEIARARAKLDSQPWTIDDARGTTSFASDLPLTFDALAKGWIIDRAVEAALAAGAQDLLLDIGGDLRVVGASRSRIGVADPRQPEDNAELLCQLELQGAACATSGGYARGFELAGRRWSHIFDPRTGMPAQDVLQATVVAPDATTADALATILNVLSPREGIALVEATPGCASMVVDADGRQHASKDWSKHLAPPSPTEVADRGADADAGRVVLAFEIQQAATGSGREGRQPQGRRGGRGEGGGGGGWRRPYVAAWIEDAQGKSVRTLCLWIQNPRWIDDLRRWSRLYANREDEVRAVTRATRSAGKYELAWDGRDDAGAKAPAGEYVACLEVVREHGTYQLLTAKFAHDGKEFAKDLAGAGVEVKSASVAFRPATKK